MAETLGKSIEKFLAGGDRLSWAPIRKTSKIVRAVTLPARVLAQGRPRSALSSFSGSPTKLLVNSALWLACVLNLTHRDTAKTPAPASTGRGRDHH